MAEKENLGSCTLYVEGMHCASCEVLIEKKLLKSKEIESVDASLKNNKVEIRYAEGKKPKIKELNQQFSDMGYTFSAKKIERSEQPLFSLDVSTGGLEVNMPKLRKYLSVLAIFASLLIAFFVFEGMQLGQYVSVDSSSSLPSFVLLGLVAGFSSCAALVGGLLLSMVKQWNELYIDADSGLTKLQPHVLFHIGRILSFGFFGGILGLVGEAISISSSAYALLTIIVSLVMVVLALQMLDVEWAQQFRFTAPKFLTRFAADESNFSGRFMPFGLGAMTFFLPCGFTLVAQSVALASGSALQGALIMLCFALGTFIPLLGISLSGVALNSKPHLTARFNLVAGLLIVFFALYNINGQLNLLGLPSLSDIQLSPTTSQANNQAAIVDERGEQTLNILASGFEYTPISSMTIQAGIPTKLIVENRGIQGCATFMAATGLIDNFVALKAGTNIIDLGTPSKGTYKLTCSMGMVRPVTITVV